MFWRVGVLVMVATAGCGALLKPPDPDRRLDVRTAGEVFDADRGYRFIVLPEPAASVIRLDVRYPVGSLHDPVGKEGLAHLVEHLLTEVEVKRDGVTTSLDAEVGRVALSYNAHTTTDSTVYETLARPAALDDLMRVEAERISTGCAGIPRALFEREREVVRNELRQRGGEGSALRQQIHEALYPAGHPYRRIDSTETVAAITYEDVCAFLVGPYRRGTAIIAISGAVDVAAVQQAVARQFARVPARQAAPLAPVPLAVPQPGTVTLRGPVDEPTLLVTWPLPAMATPEYRLLEIAWAKIAGFLGQYAFTFQWGHSASARILGGPRAPVLAVSIVLNARGALDEARARVGSALRDTLYVLARPGDERTYPRWVRQWEAEAVRVLATWESLAGRNELYADFQQFEPTGSVTGRIQELASATPLGVRALAERWLTTGRARYVLIEPSGASAVGGGGTFSAVVDRHGITVDGATADTPLPAPPASLRPRAERYTQANGLTVVLWPHGGTPLVRARLVVDAGSADDPFGMEGIAQTVGATAVYADSMLFEDDGLATRVDEVIRSVASELRLPGYGLGDAKKTYMVARLEQPRARERTAYETELRLALYGEGHPYARAASTAAGVKRLSQDVVQAWARSHVTPRNATLVLAGAFDPGLIKQHVAYTTAHVDAGARTRDVTTPPRTEPAFLVGTTTRPSPTVEIDVEFVGGRGMDADHHRRLILEAVLAAELSELREARALTYGFGASYAPRRAGGLWRIAGEVDATRAAEAGTAIIQILDGVRRDPDAYRASFVLARQKVLEGLLVASTSAGDVAETLAYHARFDLPDDHDDQLARAVAATTLTEFHAFLVRELDPARQVFGAFGTPGPAQAAVAAARAAQTAQAAVPSPATAPSPTPPAPATIVDPFQ